MKRTFIFLCALTVLLMACTLTQAGFYGNPLPDPSPVPTEADPAPTERATRLNAPVETVKKTCTVTATSLHLRDAGSHNAAHIAFVVAGDVLTVISPGDWPMVQNDEGQVGFVNGAYCE
jgi:hypothetical protein